MKIFITAFCASMLFFVSCKKSEDDNNIAKGTYSFTMDGKQYTGAAGGSITSGSDDFLLSIAGTDSARELFGIMMDLSHSDKKPGTYPDELFSYTMGDTAYIGTVTVVLTQFSSAYAEGTFSGKASNQSTGSIADITNGMFKAPLLQ